MDWLKCSLKAMKLEIVFMKHCAPSHMLVHKDVALFKDMGHLKFEALSMQLYYSSSSIS